MSATPAPERDGTGVPADYMDKWRERWPEWPLAEVFVAADLRETALAWASLQQELLDAAWGGSDARPGEAKLAWWAEELHGWSQGRRRHPLGRVLQSRAAPWSELGAALPALLRTRERPLDGDDAFASIRQPAEAAARIDAALSAEPVPAADGTVAATWLASRVLQQGLPSVPLSLLAAPEQGDAVACWRQELLRRWPSRSGAPRVRRLWNALARLRLAAPPGGVPASWRVLWAAWGAARN